MPKVKVVCSRCGKFFEKYICPSHNPKQHFCSPQCNMQTMNEELNSKRMTPEVKAKLRKSHLGTGEGKTYEKTYSRHTHRVVAEQMLGRKLKPGETVHHIDGNKRNNDPENLIVFNSRAEHTWFHACIVEDFRR